MRVTIFPTISGDVAQESEMSWQDIVTLCEQPRIYPSKQACPLIKFATFGTLRTKKGALRHDDNMIVCTGVEGDYDGERMQPRDASALMQLAGIRCVIYTSPSHTPGTPRWRVLAPFTATRAPSERRELLGRINAALGGVLAGESFKISQTYYIGRVLAAPYECYNVPGAEVDTLPSNTPSCAPVPPPPVVILDAKPYTPNKDEPECLRRLVDCLVTAPSGERHAARLRAGKLAGGYIAGGLVNEDTAIKTLQETSDKISDGGKTSYLEWQAITDGVEHGKNVPIIGISTGRDLTTIFGHSVTAPRRISRDDALLGPDKQIELFAGCVYVSDVHRVMVPGGYLLDKQRFDVRYGGRSFIMNNDNAGTPSKSAWEAFTNSQAVCYPTADTLCFRPESPPGALIIEAGQTLANIWCPVETDKTPGDVAPFLTLLGKLLPNDHDRAILLAYMAAIIQHPGKKFQWCPVVQGAEGNGKSFIGTCIERAIGERYSHRPKSSDIGSKFNAWIQARLFICVEEIHTQDKREILEVLKDMVTNRRIEIQGKGNDQVTGDNRANFMMFTNHKDAVPVDADKRRYAIFYTAQQCKADIERDGMDGKFFPRLYGWADAGGYAHVAHYLSTYPIPDEMNPATESHRAPATSSTSEAISVSLGAVEQEIMEAIESNSYPGMMNGWLSHLAVKKLLLDTRRPMTVQRQARIIASLGYVPHPALPDGRTCNVVYIPDNGRPRLYIKPGSLLANIQTPAEVARAYQEKQGMAFGQGVVSAVS